MQLPYAGGDHRWSERSKLGMLRAMCSKQPMETAYEEKQEEFADETEAAKAIAESVEEKWLAKPYEALVAMETGEDEAVALMVWERKAAGEELCSKWMKKAKLYHTFA